MKTMKKKRRINKTTALLTSATLISALVCGCAEESNSSNSGSSGIMEIPKAQQLFECTELTAPDENTHMEIMEFYSGKLYVLQSSYESGEAALFSMYEYDTKGKGGKLFDYQPAGQNANVMDFICLSDGSFVFSVRSGRNPDMEPQPDDADFDWEAYYDGYVYTHTLDTVSAEGELLESLETDGSGSICADENSSYILLSDRGIDEAEAYMIHSDGTTSELPDIGVSLVTDFEKAADGSLLIFAIDDGDSVLKKWNAAAEKFEAVALPNASSLFFNGLIPGISADTPYYLQSDQGIYAVSADGTIAESVSFMDSGISCPSGSQIFCTGENIFTGLLYNDSGDTYIAEISVQTEEQPEARILTLGCHGIGTDLTEAVSEFNRSQDEYKIQVENYEKYDDDSDGSESKGLLRLNEDIAAGKAPDILVIWDDYRMLAENGAFMNLYDLMGTNGTFAKEDFLPNYLKANEIDGGLYWIQPQFRLDTLFVNSDMTDGKESWTLQEFVDICRQCDEQGIEITNYQTREKFMDLVTGGNNFVDFENGTCRFDDPAFLDALKFAEEMYIDVRPDFENMTAEETDAYYKEDAAKCMNGERMMMNFLLCTSIQDYYLLKAMFGEQPSTVIGYPVLDESRSGHCFGRINELYAISSTCSEPEAAWQFINMQLEGEPDDTYGLSVISDKLKDDLKAQVEDINTHNTGGINGVQIEYPELTQEDADAFYEFILSLEEVSEERNLIYDIYNDVMQGFYDGTKSAEQTAEELQERVSLYLKENQ